jgi:hypothetical protein
MNDKHSRRWGWHAPLALSRRVALALCVVLTCAAFASAAAEPGRCDRQCLQRAVDGYLAAMLAHDAARISAQGAVRYTENTIPLILGQGLWATLSALESYKIYIADPEDGEVAYIGTLRENGIGAILALRLKVVGGRIREAEALVHRNAADTSELEKRGEPDAQWSESLPAGEHPSREQLVRAADLYFWGLTHLDGNRVPFADDCVRVLDGTQDTLNPADRSFMFGSLNPSALTCRQNLNNGIWAYIHSIHPRRYVVDRERGIVLGLVRYNHPGNVTIAHVPNVGDVKYPAFIIRPSSLEAAEFFKIRGEKIHLIQAVTLGVPYLQPDGWGRCDQTCAGRPAQE